MDEPQLEVENVESSTEKPGIDEVLESAFADNADEKPMEVDENTLNEKASTSAEAATVSVDDIIPEDALAKDVGEDAEDVVAESPANIDPDESLGQVELNLDKHDELDETANTETDQLDFTERSVNFSQLNVEHEDDDSNDAFNALKKSETDALQTPKEELDEVKELDGDSKDSKDIEKQDQDSEVAVDTNVDVEPMETNQPEAELAENAEDTSAPAEKEVEESHAATSTADLDDDSDGDNNADLGDDADAPLSEPNADLEELPEVPDDDGTTETTNEGEGVDEDVCLLGDETEINEAESEKEVEDTAIGKDTSTDSLAAVDTAEKDYNTASVDAELPGTTEVLDIEDTDSQPLKPNEIREIVGPQTEQSCLNCENSTKCQYELLEESDEKKYLCTFNCVREHREDNPDKYSLTVKPTYIQEISPEENQCSKCEETKPCQYRYSLKEFSIVPKETPAPAEGEEGSEITEAATETVETTVIKFICEEDCLKAFTAVNPEKYVVRPIAEKTLEAEAEKEPEQEIPKIVARSDAQVEAARLDREQSFVRKCMQCFNTVAQQAIIWETLDFCNEKCLGLYQNLVGATCVQCNEVVSLSSIGKLCVRFGSEIKQFCTPHCLNEFKTSYHPCSLCSKNLKKDVNDVISTKRGKSFCDEDCAKTYDTIINPRKNRSPYLCSVCNNKKSPEVVALLDGDIHRFCSNPCFSAFKFVNNVVPDQCEMCTKYFERKSANAFTIYQSDQAKLFCTEICKNIFITKSREIWRCNWCKVSKFNYDMIQPMDGKNPMCSLNCISLHEVSSNAISRKHADCDHCEQQKQPQYHLTMSDASIRNFCTYQCVLGFQSQFSRARAMGETPAVVPAGTAKRITPARVSSAEFDKQPVPVISRVQSLTLRRGGRKPYNPIANRRSGSPIPVPELTVQLERLSDLPARVKVSSLSSLTGGPSGWSPASSSSVRVEHKTQVVTIPPLPKQVGNKSTMCKAITLNKAINCVPATAEAECQTEDWLEQRIIVPVPIVVYVPQPMMMYSLPTPVAVPFVLPVPVPVFVPTTRNSASGIMKEIKKIQEKMPTDPYEAELLMMAEMVAGDKKREETDSDSDENNDIEYGDGLENNSSFNEDLVQMAFKMAGNDFDDPPVDLENEMTANTIQSSNAYGDDMDPHSLQHHQLLLLQQQRDAVASMQSNRGRKRMQQPMKPTNNRNVTPSKRIKREMEVMQPEMPREPAEKPDANMCLKYTFGVNAWKQWVATKNADFEKSSIRRKPIKSEILQLTADELNYSLCMFVKEVRKPNGSEYAPDTIYYLVLGIQQYLYENGRIDNIFTDRYYEQFTDCLDEVAKKFSVLYNDSQYIVTRVEEEHLWECKQLGAHSPHVLLSTLMFFNTKHFNLVTVDEHMELSFSHIMKHWKRNPNQPGAAKVPGSRNVLLRFYPPQSSLDANSRKKKVYEQQENEENPLRCPVKLYEFYLSKCPESVKTRNDVFYLQPERSCVPDSPVWYSTAPLSRDALSKMLHRVKMVKEINIALLTS